MRFRNILVRPLDDRAFWYEPGSEPLGTASRQAQVKIRHESTPGYTWNSWRLRPGCGFLVQSGAPLDTTENRGQTPLHLAARSGDPELIRRLAAQGLDVNARDDFGDTPLADIAGAGNSEVIATLIELGADVNTRGMNQLTPLHRAVSNNYEPVIRMLVAAGADPMIPDRTGETPLDVAQRKHLAIGKLLEDAAAEARHAE